MLTLLPTGLLGLVAASLIAAFMSTMSTQVNLGASYLVNDLSIRYNWLDRYNLYFDIINILDKK